MEDPRRFALKRLASRCWFTFISVTALAVVGWLGWMLPPYVKARVYDYRIRHGDQEANMIALGRLHHAAGQAILEDYACEPDPLDRYAQWEATLATWVLRRYYPDSRVARGVAEYKQIMGRSDTALSLDNFSAPPVIDKDRLRAWISRYDPHPSTDDAYLVLARETERTDPIEALRLLHTGFHSPDGDAHDEIAKRFQLTLERRSTADQLEGWLHSDCPSHAVPNVAYVAAIKRMREGHYREAIPLLERFLASLPMESPELRGDPMPGGQHYDSGSWDKWVNAPEKRWHLAERQLDAYRWFAEQSDRLATEMDAEARATILHAMARRCFRSRDLFVNCFYYEMVFTEESEWGSEEMGLLDISLDNNYRQAADIFRRIVREYPNYSQLEAVQYSIPLCLWRVRTQFPIGTGARLDQAIYCGFQAFANAYPSSSMADDALYLAGIHHWMSTDLDSCTAEIGRDSSILEANMRRIAAEYDDGDIIPRYGETNPWLRMALLARQYELNPAAAHFDVAGVIDQMRVWKARMTLLGSQTARSEMPLRSRSSDVLRE